MLPMVVAAREHELTLVPDDLGAKHQIAGSQAVAHYTGIESSMPDIGDVSRKQRPGFSPVGLVVVQHLALGSA